MNFIRSHLTFNRSQRDGILSLIVSIVVLLFVLLFADFSEETALDISSSEVFVIQKKIDSLKAIQHKEKTTEIFTFNPNFITEYKAYTLGMSTEEFDRLKDFRKKGLWINSVADFKRVTQVSDSMLREISPLFRFPEWVSRPKQHISTGFNKNRSSSYSEKTDLNIATQQELQQVYGIGEQLSVRIVKYREKLGGFSDDLQLYNIYGLRQQVIENVLERFTVKTPVEITKYNINTASASDIATIPGVSFELAKKIWEFRKLREGISDLSELLKIEGISEQKLRLIALYLSVE